jgi:hypothetical protein
VISCKDHLQHKIRSINLLLPFPPPPASLDWRLSQPHPRCPSNTHVSAILDMPPPPGNALSLSSERGTSSEFRVLGDRSHSLAGRVSVERRGSHFIIICRNSVSDYSPSYSADRAQKTLGIVGGTPDYIPVPGFEVPDVPVRSYRYSADGRLYAYALPNLSVI